MITPYEDIDTDEIYDDCPFCGSSSVFAGELEHDYDKTYHREKECQECEGTWTEEFDFKLTVPQVHPTDEED